MILRNLSLGLAEGDIEGRIALLSAIVLSSSVYLSGLSIPVSISVIFISAVFSKLKNFRLIFGMSPFLILILISGLFFDLSYSVKSAIAFSAVLSTGAIIYSSRISEICGAMAYFKFPERLISMIQLSLSIFPLIVRDLQEIMWVIDGRGFERYSRVMKAFVSTAVLRGISLSEALYSKNFTFRPLYTLRKPKIKDYALILLSLSVFLSTMIQAL